MNEFIFKNAINITALHAKLDDFMYKTHAHQEYAIGVTLNGIQAYNLKNDFILSHSDGIMFFNPEENHDGMAYNGQTLEYVMLYIKPEQLLEASNLNQLYQFEKPIIYDENIKSNILRLASAIFNEESDDVCYGLFLKLIDSLQVDSTHLFSQFEDNKLSLAQEIIKQQLTEKLNIDNIAQQLGMSKYQFIRFFKRQCGITPYQYYINYKVEKAKHIIETYRDVYWAIVECGFVDLAHLNKCFKYRYGVTAHQYMSQFR